MTPASKKGASEAITRLEQRLRGDGATEHTIQQYLGDARHFEKFIGKRSLDRWALYDYMDHLRKEGYKESTINFKIYVVVKAYFNILGVDWPLPKRRRLMIQEEDEEGQPAMAPEKVGQLITGARNHIQVTAQELAFLALSTTYGLRRVEMVRARPEDIDLEAERLLKRTAKGGLRRAYLIPPEIKPYLADYSFEPISEAWASTVFRNLCDKCGIERQPREGWHSIRHSLDTCLMDHLREVVVDRFMGWGGGEPRMRRRYYSRDDLEVDQEVFAVHPFLPYWR